MKTSIGNRITISKKDAETIIKVEGTIEPWMNHALLGWLVMWTLVGGYVMYYVVTGKAVNDQFYFFITYLAFWAYFEVKALYSWLFRAFGYELIKITPEHIFMKRSLFGYGKVARVDRGNIEDLRQVEQPKKSVNAAFNKAFWVMGNEQIQFEAIGKLYGFGMHLDENDAKELLALIRKLLRKK